MTRFIDPYDAALFDLDGVIYLGPHAVDHAPASLAALRDLGVRVGFVTNNASRTPQTVSDHLNELEVECHLADVVTSAQAIAQLMIRQLPAGARVLVCGAQALADEMTAVGFTVVRDHTESPDAVVQGYDPQMTWPRLDDASYAIQRGARWYVSNTDSTKPTNLGLAPGAGAMVHAIGLTNDVEPIIAGKPYPPLLHETVKRLESKSPVFIGDRLDTDIEGANSVDMDSLMVFTGAHGKYDVSSAIPAQRPTAIGFDLRSLLEPQRSATIEGDRVVCRHANAQQVNGRVRIEGPVNSVEEQLDALWAITQLTWRDEGLDATQALESLHLLH
ncbi:MAG: HAD-IIA family hydrolase [Brooklawnia sp.]